MSSPACQHVHATDLPIKRHCSVHALRALARYCGDGLSSLRCENAAPRCQAAGLHEPCRLTSHAVRRHEQVSARCHHTALLRLHMSEGVLDSVGSVRQESDFRELELAAVVGGKYFLSDLCRRVLQLQCLERWASLP
jgi:hypothetical protein